MWQGQLHHKENLNFEFKFSKTIWVNVAYSVYVMLHPIFPQCNLKCLPSPPWYQSWQNWRIYIPCYFILIKVYFTFHFASSWLYAPPETNTCTGVWLMLLLQYSPQSALVLDDRNDWNQVYFTQPVLTTCWHSSCCCCSSVVVTKEIVSQNAELIHWPHSERHWATSWRVTKGVKVTIGYPVGSCLFDLHPFAWCASIYFISLIGFLINALKDCTKYTETNERTYVVREPSNTCKHQINVAAYKHMKIKQNVWCRILTHVHILHKSSWFEPVLSWHLNRFNIKKKK